MFRRTLSVLFVLALVLVGTGFWLSRRWSAITVGQRTVYFDSGISADLWLHEAVHRRQWREQGFALALRYLSDSNARLDLEAEAEAAELCMHLPESSSALRAYTERRSAGHARAYLAGNVRRHRDLNRVGHYFNAGRGCEWLLRDIDLGEARRLFPAGRERRAILIAYFLQREGSGDGAIAFARARLLGRQ